MRINQQITASEVRLIDQNGEMIGVVPLQEALQKSDEAELDLIEISPNAKPPVCKISDIGKMKYEMQKKEALARKKQKTTEVKEIKMRINIGKGDYDVKVNKALKFIEKSHKVKFSISFRGREFTHLELAREIMDRVIVDMESVAKSESYPRMEGRQMTMTMVALH